MNAAPRKIYFHIGLHKTGTTYLQNVLRANRDGLLDQGVLFPGGPGQPTQVFAVWDLMGRRPAGANDTRITGTWQAAVDLVHGSTAPTTLISDEHLSLASIKHVRTAVEAFPDHEAHVIVTARDLARIFVSAWQEEVKNTGSWTWEEFAAAVRDDAQRATNPARGFWIRQDLPAICQTWQSAIPAERIHVVTVPPAGSPADLLLDRYASVVGFDPTRLVEEAPYANETIGVAGTEVLRRLNQQITGLNQRQYDRAIKLTVVHILAERTEKVRFTLPESDFAWTRARGIAMIEAVRTRGYDLVGDLAELEPQLAPGRRPDEASETEVLDAAITALTGLAENYATTWWSKKKAYGHEEIDSRKAKVSSQTRAVVFRGQRAVAHFADHNPVAAKGMGWFLRLRSARHRRAAARS